MLVALVVLFNSITFFVKADVHYSLEYSFETEDCFISFIADSKGQFVVKQIKNFSPDEQFLLVLDALGCYIAKTSDIPINKVTIIPPKIFFIGKKNLEFPATLHVRAPGVSTDQACRYQYIDIHQRFRKENSSMWHRWGPLALEKTGLTLAIIQNMAKHPDLPKIVALDTFVGNADRSSPNLYYDENADHFCGIDMAASFSSPLASAACRQMREIGCTCFTQEELSALENYAHTLEFLIDTWPPERQENFLLKLSQKAGFDPGSFLFDQDVSERIEFHRKYIKDNYKDILELIKIINQIINP